MYAAIHDMGNDKYCCAIAGYLIGGDLPTSNWRADLLSSMAASLNARATLGGLRLPAGTA